MPHLPARPSDAYLLGGVTNVDDDQAYIEYWAELRITRETTPKGLNNWLFGWIIPSAQYSQTEYFSSSRTAFLSESYVFETTYDLGVQWFLDTWDQFTTFYKLKKLWLRLDDLRESLYRVSIAKFGNMH